ncbi:hypothetical protein ACHWQZ_G003477 [Mnemiopsis leidyi]
MRNFLTTSLFVVFCLLISVDSLDSNAAVDLMSLANAICRKQKVLYYRDGFEMFCKLSKELICPQTEKTVDAAAATCKPTLNVRIQYQMKKVQKAVCQYEGSDNTTKEVQARLQDAGRCMYY